MIPLVLPPRRLPHPVRLMPRRGAGGYGHRYKPHNAPPPPPPEPPPGDTLPLYVGVRNSGDPAVWEAGYVSTMGNRTPDLYSEYVGSTAPNDWNGISSPNIVSGLLDNYQTWFATHPTRRMELATGMCPWKDFNGNQGFGLAEIPANISRFTTCAQQLATFGMQGTAQRPVYIRLGWEMGGPGYPWGTSNNDFTPNPTFMANYKSGFRLIAQTMKAAVPNNFRFTFTPHYWQWSTLVNSAYGLDWVEEIYPGDDVVDVIGTDHYDISSFYPTPPTLANDTQRQQAWNTHHIATLTNMNTFAVAHGKPQMFGEWAIWHSIGGSTVKGGSDNPIFINETFDWVTSHNNPVSGFEYISYFNRILSTVEHSLSQFGSLSKQRSRDAYNATFALLPHP